QGDFEIGRILQSQNYLSQIDLSTTIANAVPLDTELLHHTQQEVSEGIMFPGLDMTPALDPARSRSGDNVRQTRVAMHIRVTHAAAVKHDGMVQQRAVAIGCRAELLEKFREQADVVSIH